MKSQYVQKNYVELIYSFNSHAPGPVGNTVSIALRKSGIPVDVDTPAPNIYIYIN